MSGCSLKTIGHYKWSLAILKLYWTYQILLIMISLFYFRNPCKRMDRSRSDYLHYQTTCGIFGRKWRFNWLLWFLHSSSCKSRWVSRFFIRIDSLEIVEPNQFMVPRFWNMFSYFLNWRIHVSSQQSSKKGAQKTCNKCSKNNCWINVSWVIEFLTFGYKISLLLMIKILAAGFSVFVRDKCIWP